jgi:hypothetical protein
MANMDVQCFYGEFAVAGAKQGGAGAAMEAEGAKGGAKEQAVKSEQQRAEGEEGKVGPASKAEVSAGIE